MADPGNFSERGLLPAISGELNTNGNEGTDGYTKGMRELFYQTGEYS
jgi:hypothetical protein